MTRDELFAWAEKLVESRGGNLIPPIRRDLGDREPELILSSLNVIFKEIMHGYEDKNEGAVYPWLDQEEIEEAPFDEGHGNLWD